MIESISLLDILEMDDIEKLSGSPWREQVYKLLTGELGPFALEESMAFKPDTITAAYMCWAAFRSRDKSGMLKSRPTYEVWDMIGTRLQLALRRARGLHGLAVELYGPLGLDEATVLTRQDRVWIRLHHSDPKGKRISMLRSRAAQSEITTAAQLMNGWFWDLKKILTDEFYQEHDSDGAGA